MRDPTSWPSRKKFWMKNARARLLFNRSFHLSEEVEDEIDALEDLLAQVKRFRNDCKPAVSRLPTEILVAIFLAAHEDDISERFMDQDDTGPRHWLSVAQVCHHWREVSMHTQCLWTDVLFPPMTRQFAQETANRAGSMPLSVYYCYSESAKHKDAYVRGICDVDGIQPNRIRFMHAEIGDETCPTLERPLPSLESLRLTNKSGSYRIRIVGDLDTLFPRLSSLRIHNCVIPWDSTVFSQLSHLSLSFYPHYHLLSLEEINDLFRQLSRVESMSIQHLRFYTATSLVVLPTSLLSLHITERKNADEGFKFAKSIARQDRTRITIDVRECAVESIYLEDVWKASSDCHLGAFPPAALSVMKEEDRREDREFTQMTLTIGVRRTRWPSPPSSTSWEPIPDDDIRISSDRVSEDFSGEYFDLEMDDLGISVDEVLDLSLDFPRGDSAFNAFERELLACASKVQRLHTSEQTLALLVEILKGGDSGSPSSPANFLLPYLDTLCVVPCKIKTKPNYAELAEYLDARKRAGCPVRELQIPMSVPRDVVQGVSLKGEAETVVGIADETHMWKLLRDSVSVLRHSREGYY